MGNKCCWFGVFHFAQLQCRTSWLSTCIRLTPGGYTCSSNKSRGADICFDCRMSYEDSRRDRTPLRSYVYISPSTTLCERRCGLLSILHTAQTEKTAGESGSPGTRIASPVLQQSQLKSPKQWHLFSTVDQRY